MDVPSNFIKIWVAAMPRSTCGLFSFSYQNFVYIYLQCVPHALPISPWFEIIIYSEPMNSEPPHTVFFQALRISSSIVLQVHKKPKQYNWKYFQPHETIIHIKEWWYSTKNFYLGTVWRRVVHVMLWSATWHLLHWWLALTTQTTEHTYWLCIQHRSSQFLVNAKGWHTCNVPAPTANMTQIMK